MEENNISRLFIGQEYTNEINKILNLTPEDRAKAWKLFIQHLKNNFNFDSSFNNLLESYFPKDSLMKFINDNCDIDNVNIENFRTENKEPIPPGADIGYWNESLQKAINFYFNNIEVLGKDDNRQIDGAEFATETDIKNADAGRRFYQDNDIDDEDAFWVRLWNNINFDSYSSVRNDDKVKSVLNNPLNLQFTREPQDYRKDGNIQKIDTSTYGIINRWLRLLMPKNTRRVEVEDLNRNFWVIAQTLAIICGYLFDEDSPIPEMFKKLIDEVMQLWENILYLWLALAIESQKFCTDIHVEVLPLPNSTLLPEKKYDNFDVKDSDILDDTYKIPSADKVQERIAFLADKYSDKNLIIVPIIRRNNYKHNYYKEEFYSYVFFYHRGKEEWTHTTINGGIGAKFSISGYEQHLYASREEEDGYRYFAPLAFIGDEDNDPETGTSKVFYSGIRVIPEIEATVDVEKININKFILHGYDAMSSLENVNNEILKWEYNNIQGSWDSSVESMNLKLTEYVLYPQTIKYKKISLNDIENNGYQKYYLGEVASDYSISKKVIKEHSITLYNMNNSETNYSEEHMKNLILNNVNPGINTINYYLMYYINDDTPENTSDSDNGFAFNGIVKLEIDNKGSKKAEVVVNLAEMYRSGTKEQQICSMFWSEVKVANLVLPEDEIPNVTFKTTKLQVTGSGDYSIDLQFYDYNAALQSSLGIDDPNIQISKISFRSVENSLTVTRQYLNSNKYKGEPLWYNLTSEVVS